MILAAAEGLDAPLVTERVATLKALIEALPRLADLSGAEWAVKLLTIEDDIEELGRAADVAASRLEQAQLALETLRQIAEQYGADPSDRSAVQQNLFGAYEIPPEAARRAEAGRRVRPEVAQAKTTREAMLSVMAKRPHRRWTPTLITEELRRAGRPVSRENVQVTLRRLVDDGRITRVGHGTYELGRRSGRSNAEDDTERSEREPERQAEDTPQPRQKQRKGGGR